MINNIAIRNTYLMLAIAFWAGMAYCIYDTILNDTSWIKICPVVIAPAMFTRFYMSYRKAVKNGNIHGHVDRFG